MKLLLYCIECQGDSVKPMLAKSKTKVCIFVKCENGHRFMYTVSNAKFEILFEMALLALIDGYTREAVATLAATVEEFYRFFAKVVLAKRGMYEDAKFDELADLWQLLDGAEPQVEAFTVLYFLEKGKAPTFPDPKSTNFRNGVIHRGRIPKYDEVVSYGERITKFLIPLWKENREGFEHFLVTGMDLMGEIRSKDEQKTLPKAGSHYPSAIGRLFEQEEPSFHEAVELVRESSFLKK